MAKKQPKPSKKPVAKKQAPAKKPPAKKKSTTMAENGPPTLWFDGDLIPKGLKGAKLGDTVTITAQVKVIRRSEDLNNGESLTAEVKNIEPAKTAKPTAPAKK